MMGGRLEIFVDFVQVVLFSFVCRDIGGKRFLCAIDVMILMTSF
jgi:hypothetical protein